MINKTSNKNAGSTKLEAFIVEPILMACMDDATIEEIGKRIEIQIPSHLSITKEYLFFLVEFGLVFYDGRRRIFSIGNEGWEMIHTLSRKKKSNVVDIKDIVIIIG